MKFGKTIEDASKLVTDSEHRFVSETEKAGYSNIRADSTKPFIIEVRTTDPVSPEVGRIWFRSDL